MTPDLTNSTEHDRDDQAQAQGHSFDGDPVTDSDSKTVMISSERHDVIEITDIANRIAPNVVIPTEFSVIQRKERYYGPELLLHSEVNGLDQNFLLTAPGPTYQLRLWAAEQSDENRRSGWTAIAEVQAALSVEQPPYERCGQCGEEIRTIEHERMSILGQCQRK